MKRIFHILTITLFVAALWLPLFCTPYRCRQERETLRLVERRTPNGTLTFSRCDRNIERWVKEVQRWYCDSFAFRSKLMRVYNVSNYLIHHYPTGFYGQSGHLFQKELIESKLKPVGAEAWGRMAENLAALRQVCDQQKVPCLFILIPVKETVHPELAPRWIRDRGSSRKRQALVDLIRTNDFPVLDLAPVLKSDAEQTGRILFRKYDTHWNFEGARVGYLEMMTAIQEFISAARTVTDEEVVLTLDGQAEGYTKRFYLDGILSEPLSRIKQINLPPVKIIKNGKEEYRALQGVVRLGRTDVFCPDRADRTVVFIRDSFFILPSQLFNHSFAHTVYLNHSAEGANPKQVIGADHPDLLVIALQEDLMGDYLAGVKE